MARMTEVGFVHSSLLYLILADLQQSGNDKINPGHKNILCGSIHPRVYYLKYE